MTGLPTRIVIKHDPKKGVRLVREGSSTYLVQTYRPSTGELLSTRKFEFAARSAHRYYARALTAAQSTRHLDNSSLSNPQRFLKRR